MLDPIVAESLEIIDRAIETIQFRFKKIVTTDADDLSEDEITLLDSIAMRLLLIGECTKRIEHHSPGLFSSHGIEAKPIIRMRDFLSHHYEDVDLGIIMETCTARLPDFGAKINAMRQ